MARGPIWQQRTLDISSLTAFSWILNCNGLKSGQLLNYAIYYIRTTHRYNMKKVTLFFFVHTIFVIGQRKIVYVLGWSHTAFIAQHRSLNLYGIYIVYVYKYALYVLYLACIYFSGVLIAPNMCFFNLQNRHTQTE